MITRARWLLVPVTTMILGVGTAAPPAASQPATSSAGRDVPTLVAFRALDHAAVAPRATEAVPERGVHGVPASGVGVGLPGSGYQVCSSRNDDQVEDACYGTGDGSAPDLVAVTAGSTTSGINATLQAR